MAAFYGKLPAKGDFLSRNLPREFVDTWDNWLQTGMNSSRQVLGDAWLETYLTSPLWRFVLPAGVCGQPAWAGVLMPSMDKVGRYFPMTIVHALTDVVSPICVAAQNNAWFEQVEDTLLAALDDEGLQLEDFDRVVQSLEFGDADIAAIDNQLEPGRGACVPLGDDLNIPRALLGFSLQGVRDATAGLGFWWGSGSDSISPSLLVTRGLPAPEMFTAMLSGHWSNYGWRDDSGVFPAPIADPLARLVDDLVE